MNCEYRVIEGLFPRPHCVVRDLISRTSCQPGTTWFSTNKSENQAVKSKGHAGNMWNHRVPRVRESVVFYGNKYLERSFHCMKYDFTCMKSRSGNGESTYKESKDEISIQPRHTWDLPICLLREITEQVGEKHTTTQALYHGLVCEIFVLACTCVLCTGRNEES